MSNIDVIDELYEETQLIIDELLEDGSDPEAIYTIEHHFASDNPEDLEKAAVEAYRLSYEVTDPEEIEDEDGSTVYCCDVISEVPLKADIINQQIDQLVAIADKHEVTYDGWGTYFVDAEGEDEDDDEFYDEDDDDDERNTYH